MLLIMFNADSMLLLEDILNRLSPTDPGALTCKNGWPEADGAFTYELRKSLALLMVYLAFTSSGEARPRSTGLTEFI